MCDCNNERGELEPALGVANFKEVRQKGIFYADKTRLLYRLISNGSPCFLARPRRFGKTILVSTIQHILLGHRELFEGLWIHGSDYDWTPCPVIRLDMSAAAADSLEEMSCNLMLMLEDTAKREGLEIPASTPKWALTKLIRALKEKHEKLVSILIDEYDAPITRHLADPAKAEAFRLALRDFYGVLKTASDDRGLVFVTGVTRFTKTSIFSELNDLRDLTYDSSYAEICGFGEADLDALLGRYQAGVLAKFLKNGAMDPGSTGEDLRGLILDWYDGYSFDGRTRVINPWSTLSCLAAGEFQEFWYESGTPSFIRNLLGSGQLSFDFPQETAPVTAPQMAIDDIAKAKPSVLLLQAGYLTLKDAFSGHGSKKKYSVGVPNLEVTQAILPFLSPIEPKKLVPASGWAKRTHDSLLRLDKPEFERSFHHFLELWPYEDHAPLESYYRTQFRTAMFMAGQPTSAQEQTGSGRLDFRVERPDLSNFIIEVKHLKAGEDDEKPASPGKAAKLDEEMSKLAKEAMDQISEKYVSAFEGKGSRIVKVALVVSKRSKVMVEFEAYWSPLA